MQPNSCSPLSLCLLVWRLASSNNAGSAATGHSRSLLHVWCRSRAPVRVSTRNVLSEHWQKTLLYTCLEGTLWHRSKHTQKPHGCEYCPLWQLAISSIVHQRTYTRSVDNLYGAVCGSAPASLEVSWYRAQVMPQMSRFYHVQRETATTKRSVPPTSRRADRLGDKCSVSLFAIYNESPPSRRDLFLLVAFLVCQFKDRVRHHGSFPPRICG